MYQQWPVQSRHPQTNPSPSQGKPSTDQNLQLHDGVPLSLTMCVPWTQLVQQRSSQENITKSETLLLLTLVQS